jgi:cyclophilin family peptidyl-prolyl cis-trans isomerase
MAGLLVIDTVIGSITLHLLPETAPQTVSHIRNITKSKLYDGTSFYRSDFVIQFGLHGTGRTSGSLTVNETGCTGKTVSNTRGTASVAHFDVPDCGGSELFINLGDNAHLDSAYGGYCVFARVDPSDQASFRVIDAIAAEVKSKGTVTIRSVRIQ